MTPLTVTATSGSKIYDGTAAGIGVSYSVTPDMSKVLGTTTYTGAVKDVITSPHTITPGGFYSNQQGYDISYASGRIDRDPGPLTVTAERSEDLRPDTRPVAVQPTAGLVNGETVGSVTETSPGTLATASVVGSPFAITPSNPVGGTFTPSNYTISYVNGALTVTPAPLTVTASNTSKTYGQAPTWRYSAPRAW